MANTVYISAGLPVAKDSGQSPASGVNTVYVSAGLPAEVSEEAVKIGKKAPLPMFFH
jgi:hypothetical protein